jgi:hypothetical protein
MSSSPIPTKDEIINSIKRSDYPIILIEGPSDSFIYRKLKARLKNPLISFQPCGGRVTLFAIHDQRHEFRNKKVAFIADKDLYRFNGIPESRSDIIFTDGYSIENDIYFNSTIEKFIDDSNASTFHQLKHTVTKWFCFEISKLINQTSAPEIGAPSLSTHINQICPPGNINICCNFASQISYVEPSQESINEIIKEYKLDIRGKQLFQILSRAISTGEHMANFSDKQLIEIALTYVDEKWSDHYIEQLTHSLKLCAN